MISQNQEAIKKKKFQVYLDLPEQASGQDHDWSAFKSQVDVINQWLGGLPGFRALKNQMHADGKNTEVQYRHLDKQPFHKLNSTLWTEAFLYDRHSLKTQYLLIFTVNKQQIKKISKHSVGNKD